MASSSEIINWTEAMQQVGDDEEFLKELLADLRSELQTQLTTIQGIIQVGSFYRGPNRLAMLMPTCPGRFACFYILLGLN